MKRSGLLTDLYELTMMQGYLFQNRNETVVFDMFFRKQPFDGGYSVFAGIEEILTILEQFGFSDSDIEYLDSLGKFEPAFLDYLKAFRFTGDVYSMEEGEIVFP